MSKAIVSCCGNEDRAWRWSNPLQAVGPGGQISFEINASQSLRCRELDALSVPEVLDDEVEKDILVTCGRIAKPGRRWVWQGCCKMDHLCHESDVSRKSGYESFHRIEALSVRLRQEHPGWGAPKIREKLK